MLVEYLWYALFGLLAALIFLGALLLNVWYERGRRRADAKMTPEERKEKAVRANAAAKGWGLPF
jgi:uncharacterized protein (DUF58 family)